MNMTYAARQNISVLLILSMIFSMWISVAPLKTAEAGILSTVGNVAKSLFVNVGALAAGGLGAVVGMAVGGGPLGMAIGGLAGYVVSKKVLNWTTSSVANFATVAGAIGGGLLCAGMGFPMLAVGIVGGGLLSRLVVKGVTKLFGKTKNITVSKSDIDEEAAQTQAKEVEDYISALMAAGSETSVSNTSSSDTVVPVYTGEPRNSQEAYDKYMAAYTEYTTAASNGDTEGAKRALDTYKVYFQMYNEFINQGK